MDHPAAGEGEKLLLPLPVIQDVVDPHIRYEKSSASVILTTPREVTRAELGSRTGSRNGKPVSLEESPEKIGDTVYIPADLLKKVYGISVHQDNSTGSVILMNPGDRISLAKAKPAKETGTVPIRKGPSDKTPIVLDASLGERLRIWGKEENWYRVQADNGFIGFMKSSHLEQAGEKVIPKLPVPVTRAEKEWKNKSVNMVWEAIYSRNPDPNKIGKLPGINVVSPTWFSLADAGGDIVSKADPDYVAWAHARKMEVWGLFSNSFNPDITTGALASFETRSRMISQLLQYAAQYKLDGINIDFENVHTKDKDNLVQFVRELKPLADDRGLIISIDVTPKSSTPMWSAFLDRRELAQAVDYMIVMSYDEHWAASPKAGSVSSLPWAERTILRIMEEDEVSPSKLILGVPLYARVWTEEGENGGGKVSSKALGMDKLRSLLRDKKLTPAFDEASGQNYAEYKEGGNLHRIWIEDETSLKARVKLARSLKLAGVASWNRNLGVSEAWEVLKGIHD